ncbi:MAG: NUDIX hydrolase [Caldilineaceae bacterium]|nr:NUDIX hydrolase [Caldilineaceae bacterium]
MEAWQTLKRTPALKSGDGRFLQVENHTVQLPNGHIIEEWPWVITPDYVNVVAITAAGEFLCFQQTKYAVAGLSLAIVGGYLEAGEDPLAAAQRELREETGYQAPIWRALGHYAVDGNRGCGTAHLFVAREAVWTQPIQADDLEEQKLLHLSLTEIKRALQQGEFKVLAWAAAIALALLPE